jgi:hypothetical protein
MRIISVLTERPFESNYQKKAAVPVLRTRTRTNITLQSRRIVPWCKNTIKIPIYRDFHHNENQITSYLSVRFVA